MSSEDQDLVLTMPENNLGTKYGTSPKKKTKTHEIRFPSNNVYQQREKKRQNSCDKAWNRTHMKTLTHEYLLEKAK